MWLVYLVPAIATGLMASSTKEMPVTRWVLACVATGAVTNAITNLTYQQDLAAALQCAVCGAVGALLAAALTIRSRR
jgi:predicted CDP-diglyceride synthetase/phosphatidate cytidylyltransferase